MREGMSPVLALHLSLPAASLTALLWRRTGAGLFSAALVGGLAGFLVYNFHPAQVFMGDTGSLALGGFVTAAAFLMDMPMLILVFGFIYVAEVVSVILQVAYFKATHGKRLFKMAPIHHHFELLGWHETKVVTVFTSVTLLLCLVSLWIVFRP